MSNELKKKKKKKMRRVDTESALRQTALSSPTAQKKLKKILEEMKKTR